MFILDLKSYLPTLKRLGQIDPQHHLCIQTLHRHSTTHQSVQILQMGS